MKTSLIGASLLLLVVIIGFTFASIPAQDDLYQIGTAKYDITGPAAEVGMMGYAMVQQVM